MKVAAAVVGHQDTNTTLRHYTHTADDLETPGVEALAELLRGGRRGKLAPGGKKGGNRHTNDPGLGAADGAKYLILLVARREGLEPPTF